MEKISRILILLVIVLFTSCNNYISPPKGYIGIYYNEHLYFIDKNIARKYKLKPYKDISNNQYKLLKCYLK